MKVVRYFFVGGAAAGVDFLVFALLIFAFGMPYAFMWAFLAGVLRYVPYIGPWVAALFPMIISMVASDRLPLLSSRLVTFVFKKI